MFHVFAFLMPWADASRRVFADLGRLIVGCLPSDP
mgnify:CR=1 FL=1